MCCFSGPVEHVSSTRIFARLDPDAGVQFLAYQMNFSAAEDLAMILPIPTDPEKGEDAVEFISLEDYDRFFRDLKRGFPERRPRAAAGGLTLGIGAKTDSLEVHDVGSFEASFVPTVADFSRLDARFRLPDEAWDELPAYQKFGFAVFKLKSSDSEIHPMALKFFPAAAESVFFPTVHIHDGEVHDKAEFDHTLYLQGAPQSMTRGFGFFNRWRESEGPAKQFVDAEKSAGLVLGDEHVYQFKVEGRYANKDIRVTPQLI